MSVTPTAASVQRLRHRSQFDAVMSGPPVIKTAHFALHVLTGTAKASALALFVPGQTAIGVMLPKRWAKRAVTRNTLRRQIYAVTQAQAQALPRQPMVVRLRSGFARQDFPSATSDALKAVVRAELQQLLGDKLSHWRQRHGGAPHGSA